LKTIRDYSAPLDIEQIQQILPHRYPFLFVDRILEMEDGWIVGQKCVTGNEWFFQGHFPGKPVLPGVLMIEIMAQTGAVLALSETEMRGKTAFLAGVEGVRYRKVVVPGDVLRIEMKEIMRRRNIGKTRGKVLVDGQVVCEATITFAIGE
jgi:3-hydroxyacyl-[acyl-carrier-protein] dehydratase